MEQIASCEIFHIYCSEYRERVAERERKLEAEYSSRIIALSEEVLGAKKDFEARMKSFQALQVSSSIVLCSFLAQHLFGELSSISSSFPKYIISPP